MSAFRLALAASVPAPILAELLGFHNDTTNRWRGLASGDWARYAIVSSLPRGANEELGRNELSRLAEGLR